MSCSIPNALYDIWPIEIITKRLPLRLAPITVKTDLRNNFTELRNKPHAEKFSQLYLKLQVVL